MDQRDQRHAPFVRDPGADVVGVGLEEQFRHARQRRRPPGVDALAEPRGPRQEQEIPVVGVVVRMMMGDENVPDVRQRHAGENQLARHAIAAVDDIGVVAEEDHLRGRGALLPRPRAAGGPEEDQPRFRRRRCRRAQQAAGGDRQPAAQKAPPVQGALGGHRFRVRR
jgi:hypothetical protein